jgi:hypothetical protein
MIEGEIRRQARQREHPRLGGIIGALRHATRFSDIDH